MMHRAANVTYSDTDVLTKISMDGNYCCFERCINEIKQAPRTDEYDIDFCCIYSISQLLHVCATADLLWSPFYPE